MLEVASFRPVKDVFARLAHHESQPNPDFSKDWAIEALASLQKRGVAGVELRTVHQEVKHLHPSSAPRRWIRRDVTPRKVALALNSLLLDDKVVTETVLNRTQKGPQITVLWSRAPEETKPSMV
jgi:hypothetical protein